MRLLLLVLLFTGCATPPTVYGQGIPVAPFAPAFNPAWGAPHRVGQPGYIGAPEQAPRSPHRRELPPTREAGLWAGDQPQAIIQPWKDREPIVIGTVFPDPDDPLLRLQLRKCAYLADSIFTLKMRPEDMVGGSSKVRACLASYAVRYCAKDDEGELERLRKEGIVPTVMVRDAVREMLASSNRRVETACRGDLDRDPWLVHWFGVLVQEWSRFNPRGPQ